MPGPDSLDSASAVDQPAEPPGKRVDAREGGVARFGRVAEEGVLVGVVLPVGKGKLALGPEAGQVRRVHLEFDLTGVEAFQADPVALVVFGPEAQRVSADPQIDVLGDHDQGRVRLVVA